MKKKEYAKPMIKIERFTLSQSVARNCGNGTATGTSFGTPQLQDINVCAYEIDGTAFGGTNILVFADQSFCYDPDYLVDPNDIPDEAALDAYLSMWGDFCYNNPNGGVSIFGSA